MGLCPHRRLAPLYTSQARAGQQRRTRRRRERAESGRATATRKSSEVEEVDGATARRGEQELTRPPTAAGVEMHGGGLHACGKRHLVDSARD